MHIPAPLEQQGSAGKPGYSQAGEKGDEARKDDNPFTSHFSGGKLHPVLDLPVSMKSRGFFAVGALGDE